MLNREALKSYEIYADVFSYPESSLIEKIEKVQEYLTIKYPEASKIFNNFCDFSKIINKKSWEEIYTHSFDVQALTTLDLGYVLFGDDYKRGELLVNLSKEHKKAGNECGNELADHLPNVIKLMPKLENEELLEDIISYILYPALKKIESEFDLIHIEKKRNIYQKHHKTLIDQDKSYSLIYIYTIKTLLLMLHNDFPELTVDRIFDNNYTHQITKELSIEKLR